MRRFYPLLDAHVSFLDPPAHTRIRRELAGHFTPNHIAALETFISAATATALDTLAPAGAPAEQVDVVSQLAYPIPLQVMQHLLGLSGVDLPRLRQWSNAWGDLVGAPGHLPTTDTDQVIADGEIGRASCRERVCLVV